VRLSEYEVFINVDSTASRFDAQRYASKTVKLCNNTTWTNRTWLSSFQTGTRADVFADRQTDRRTDGRNNHTLGVVHHARISSRSATWRTSREDDESVRLWLCAYLQQRGQIGTVKLRQSGRTGQTNMTSEHLLRIKTNNTRLAPTSCCELNQGQGDVRAWVELVSGRSDRRAYFWPKWPISDTMVIPSVCNCQLSTTLSLHRTESRQCRAQAYPRSCQRQFSVLYQRYLTHVFFFFFNVLTMATDMPRPDCVQ